MIGALSRKLGWARCTSEVALSTYSGNPLGGTFSEILVDIGVHAN